MKKISIIFIVMLAIVTITTGFSIQSVVAKEQEQRTLDEVITAVGQFVKKEHQLFLSGLDYKAQVTDENIAFWVNGLPISNDELQLRLGLYVSSGTGPQAKDEVNKVIVREKVIKDEVIKLGLTPTDEEINNYISQEKELLKNDLEYKTGVEKIITEWGLTEDEYWNIYERYNVYRILMLDKLGKHVLKDFYSKDKITLEDQEQAKEKWNQFCFRPHIMAES
ncbi:MAG: SurA N-terminal domain-containing protein [Syntrophomonadaceae bacterium]|nr:SurA N-terminal domain-containing protein [Syntrophomonadaceae bacterium]